MKKRFFNFMVVFLCLCLLFSVGCSSTTTSNEKGSQTSNSEQKQNDTGSAATGGDKYQPEQSKKYVIEWAKTNTHQLDDDPEIVKLVEEKFNVQLNVWSLDPKTQYEQLGLKIASGEIPDIFTVNSFDNYKKFVDEGVLLELDENIIKKYSPNMYRIYEEENPDAFKYYRINGKLYGIPTYRDHYVFGRAPVVWRGDWLENVGISKVPETVEEFEEALYKFTKNDPDKNGKNDTYGMSQSALQLFYGAFGQPKDIWFEKDGKLAYSTVQPEVKETLSYLAKWYKDGIIDPEFITGENTGGYWAITHAFVNGKIGLTSHGAYYHWTCPMFEGDVGSFNYLELEKVNPEAAKKLIYGLPPKGPNGNMGVAQESPIPGSGTVFTIKIEDDPGKLGKILQILDFAHATQDNYLTMRRGIKGKHWDYDERGNPVYIEGFDVAKAAAEGGNTLFICAEPIRYMSSKTRSFGETYKFNEGGIISKLYTSLPSASKYSADLSTLLNGAITDIITGKQPVNYFDEVVEQWYKKV